MNEVINESMKPDADDGMYPPIIENDATGATATTEAPVIVHDDPELARLNSVRDDMKGRHAAACEKRDGVLRTWMHNQSKDTAKGLDDAEREVDRLTNALRVASEDVDAYVRDKTDRATAEKRAAFEAAKAEAKPMAEIDAFAARVAPSIVDAIKALEAIDREAEQRFSAATQACYRALSIGRELGEKVETENGWPLLKAVDLDTIKHAVRNKVKAQLAVENVRDLDVPQWLRLIQR